MKRILAMLYFMISFAAFAQTDSLKLSGQIKFTGNNKYIYIYDLKSKKQYFKLINGHDFEFSFKRPHEIENRQIAIFLGQDSTRTYKDVQKIYAFMPKEYKLLIFENNVKVNIAAEIEDAEIKGGQLNIDLADMYATIKTKKYLEYFISHPNATISITFLTALLRFRDHPMFTDIINYEQCYSALSENLKQTPDGQALKKLVYAK